VEGWRRSFSLGLCALNVEVAVLGRVDNGKDSVVGLKAAVDEPPTVVENPLIYVGDFRVGKGFGQKVRMVELDRGGIEVEIQGIGIILFLHSRSNSVFGIFWRFCRGK